MKLGARAAIGGEVGAHVYKLEAVVEDLKAALSERRHQSLPFKASTSPVTAASVRQFIKDRRERDSIFGRDLFSDPAWDILLEAFASHLGQQRLSVSGLCFASRAPQTTALRWIRILEERGLLVRVQDPMDGRRSWVELSGTAVSGMHAHFATLSRSASAGEYDHAESVVPSDRG